MQPCNSTLTSWKWHLKPHHWKPSSALQLCAHRDVKPAQHQLHKMPQNTTFGPNFQAGSPRRCAIGWLPIKAALFILARLLEGLPVGWGMDPDVRLVRRQCRLADLQSGRRRPASQWGQKNVPAVDWRADGSQESSLLWAEVQVEVQMDCFTKAWAHGRRTWNVKQWEKLTITKLL